MKTVAILLLLVAPAFAQNQLLGPGLWYDPSIGLLTTTTFSGTATAADVNDLKAKLNALSKLQKPTLRKCANALTGKPRPLC